MRSNKNNRRGITKTEVFVVLVVLGIGLAVLLPATLQSTGESRLEVCKYRTAVSVTSMMNFASMNDDRLPAYRTSVAGPDSAEVSWVVQLFDYIEQPDLAGAWQTGDGPTPYLQIFVCPSEPVDDPKTAKAPLSYICNTLVCTPGEGMKVGEIPDGDVTTILVGEDLRSKVEGGRNWTMTGPREIGFDAEGTMADNLSSNHPEVINVGFVGGAVKSMSKQTDDSIFRTLVLPDDAAEMAEGEE